MNSVHQNENDLVDEKFEILVSQKKKMLRSLRLEIEGLKNTKNGLEKENLKLTQENKSLGVEIDSSYIKIHRLEQKLREAENKIIEQQRVMNEKFKELSFHNNKNTKEQYLSIKKNLFDQIKVLKKNNHRLTNKVDALEKKLHYRSIKKLKRLVENKEGVIKIMQKKHKEEINKKYKDLGLIKKMIKVYIGKVKAKKDDNKFSFGG